MSVGKYSRMQLLILFLLVFELMSRYYESEINEVVTDVSDVKIAVSSHLIPR